MIEIKESKTKTILVLIIALILSLALVPDAALAQTLPQMYQITSDANSDLDPAWSSDGKKILFKRNERIWLTETDGKTAGINSKQVSPTYGNAWSPAWRKTTNEIYYIYGPGYWYIYRQPIGGSPSNVFWVPAMTGALMGHQASSPDGAKVTFVWMSSNWNNPTWVYRLYTANADGSNLKQIYYLSGESRLGNSYIGHPSWSPDGNKIAFTSGQDGTYNIWVINTDGTGLTKLTVDGGWDPAWSPDGKEIVFEKGGNLWTIKADGTGLKQLTFDGGTNGNVYGGPDWSPDGKALVFHSNKGGSWDIWTMELTDGTDSVPPTTAASFNGTTGQNNWYVSDVQVTLTATDNDGGSGVAVTEYSFDNVKWTTYSAPFTISTEGLTTVYYRSTDNEGNVEQIKEQVINIDKTPPQVIINTPTDGGEYVLNQNVLADWSTADEPSGIASATGTILAGQAIDTSTVGSKTISVVATDNAGNQVTKIITYYITYKYSGILPPVKEDGSSVFKQGSTIPVKFQLKDADGILVANAIAKLFVVKIENGTVGEENEAVSTSAAITGNLFRYDSAENQYIFTLSTKELSAGTWQLRILLDDGTSKYANISLK